MNRQVAVELDAPEKASPVFLRILLFRKHLWAQGVFQLMGAHVGMDEPAS